MIYEGNSGLCASGCPCATGQEACDPSVADLCGTWSQNTIEQLGRVQKSSNIIKESLDAGKNGKNCVSQYLRLGLSKQKAQWLDIKRFVVQLTQPCRHTLVHIHTHRVFGSKGYLQASVVPQTVRTSLTRSQSSYLIIIP